MLAAESGAEATILTSLTRSWKMIANQTERYVAIMKKDAAEKRKGGSVTIRNAKTRAGAVRDRSSTVCGVTIDSS